MAGLQAGAPTPQAITVHSQSKVLEVVFSDGANFRIPFELMRVYSPSAEVAGHGPGQEVLQTGKREVELNAKSGAVGKRHLQHLGLAVNRDRLGRRSACLQTCHMNHLSLN